MNKLLSLLVFVSCLFAAQLVQAATTFTLNNGLGKPIRVDGKQEITGKGMSSVTVEGNRVTLEPKGTGIAFGTPVTAGALLNVSTGDYK